MSCRKGCSSDAQVDGTGSYRRGRAVTDLTLVSLFDGIGGFPLAFERAGVRTVATVEIDDDAAEVSARHFPDATQF